MTSPLNVVVVGAGVFGASAAWALARRGHRVTLLEQGTPPHPLAASSDLSKAVRGDYGADPFYAELHRACLPLWRTWPVFHETGMLFLSRAPLAPGGFEYESLRVQHALGAPVERLDSRALGPRFPAWRDAGYPDGYFNPHAGWVESSALVAHLLALAAGAGAHAHARHPVVDLAEREGRIAGVVLANGEVIAAELVVVAAGAFTPQLLPWLSGGLRAVGQPVFHFRPADPTLFQAQVFPVWAADIAGTGWYGFPLSPSGVVKVAHHGPGRMMRATDPREVAPDEEARFRAFLRERLPALADAPVAATRLCLYTDTLDGDFLIDADPDRPGLVVATGGSGHALKFAPLLGDIIADATLDAPSPWRARFSWRRSAEAVAQRSADAARFTGS